ncbi:26S proteasome non-ATPase regulatory subunit 5 [Armadillidium nasatum]|uniref:26S proteasome non-ATPase regulatory subunit 5 n=1 Tax=Armadillidium nasatum TaxID=96803 RepID=A0A5N5T9J9_9CRUS|nr:26S proteasome non-ATPase regulatory subunit 5 [Armadillidium nasatum]
MELLIEQMKKISISEDPLPLLIDMKNNLIALSDREVGAKLEAECPLSNLHPLFEVLNSSNKEQIITGVDVLGHILNKISPKIALENFMNQYLICLSHQHEKVRLLILKQILKSSKIEEAAGILINNSALLRILITGIGDPNMEIIKICIDSLVNLCKYPSATSVVFSSDNLEVLRSVMNMSDSCRFHVYDLAVQVCLLSDDSLQLMLSSGVLNQLLNEVSGGDILVQLNALELLAQMAAHPRGLNYLKMDGIVSKLSYLLSTAKTDQMAAILLPEVKVRILESLAKIFYLPIEEQNDDLLNILEIWFEHLSNKSPMSFIYNVARQPFPDLQCSTLLLFQSLAALPWGIKRMAQEPGLLEWLLNRNSCKDKDSKEKRYDVIATIHQLNPLFKTVLDGEMQRNIETFYNEGPFYVESELSVAFGEQT